METPDLSAITVGPFHATTPSSLLDGASPIWCVNVLDRSWFVKTMAGDRVHVEKHLQELVAHIEQTPWFTKTFEVRLSDNMAMALGGSDKVPKRPPVPPYEKGPVC